MTRAPRAVASSRVPSVEWASTTTISSQKATERRQASIRSASLKVIMQADKPLSLATRTSAGARTSLWLHDQVTRGSRRARWLAGTAALLREMAATAVCVSDSQRRGVEATLRRIGVAAQVRALTIYNAVEEALTPDDTPVDERKLIFFSSPNKGLNFTLDAFSALKRRMPLPPGYRLYEAAVGGLPSRWRRLPARLAASAGLFDAYLERIRAWRSGGRPRTGPDPRFRLSTVTEQWRALLRS